MPGTMLGSALPSCSWARGAIRGANGPVWLPVVAREKRLHGHRAGLDGRRQHVAVHERGHPRAVVPEHVGHVFEGHAGGRHERRRRVPHLVRHPPTDPGSVARLAEVAAQVRGVDRATVRCREHELRAVPLVRPLLSGCGALVGLEVLPPAQRVHHHRGHRSDRRDFAVLSSPNTGRLFSRLSCCRRWTIPASRSRSATTTPTARRAAAPAPRP
jgi:hypothetical protein